MTSADSRTEGTQPTDLDARYGRTPSVRARQKTIGWSAAIAVVLVFVAWVAWVAFDGTSATIETRDIGHAIVDESTVRVSFELSVTPGTDVACSLQVQNDLHAIVGWKVIEIPASDTYTRTFTENVRSIEPGVTGLLHSCWLT